MEQEHADPYREVREWVSAHRAATPDPRAAARWLAGWAGTGALVVCAICLSPPSFRAPASLLLSFWYVGAGALLHEAVHGNLFRSRAANAALGVLAGVLTTIPFATYRGFHMDHHRLATTEDDPEGTTARPASLGAHLLHWFVDYPLFAGALVAAIGLTWLGRPPSWVRTPAQRAEVRRLGAAHLAALGALVAATVSLPAGELLVWLVWVPQLVLHQFWLPFLLTSEHYGLSGGAGALDHTRTVRTNPLLQAMFWNTNLHAEHHVAPQVPSSRLPELHERMRGRVLVHRGYLSFHRHVLLGLLGRASAV